MKRLTALILVVVLGNVQAEFEVVPDNQRGTRTDVENMSEKQKELCMLHANACEFDLFAIDVIGLGGEEGEGDEGLNSKSLAI